MIINVKIGLRLIILLLTFNISKQQNRQIKDIDIIISKEKKTFEKALQVCKSLYNGILATSLNQNQLIKLRNVINSSKDCASNTYFHCSLFYIGLAKDSHSQIDPTKQKLKVPWANEESEYTSLDKCPLIGAVKNLSEDAMFQLQLFAMECNTSAGYICQQQENINIKGQIEKQEETEITEEDIRTFGILAVVLGIVLSFLFLIVCCLACKKARVSNKPEILDDKDAFVFSNFDEKFQESKIRKFLQGANPTVPSPEESEINLSSVSTSENISTV